MTTNDGTGDSGSRAYRTVRWVPGLVALAAAIGVLLLIVKGQTDSIGPVAALGAAAIAGGTLQVTVNIRR